MEKSYLITGVEPMLYKNFKAACAHYELTINEVFIKHMQNIVDDFNLIKWRETKGKPKHWKEAKKR